MKILLDSTPQIHFIAASLFVATSVLTGIIPEARASLTSIDPVDSPIAAAIAGDDDDAREDAVRSAAEAGASVVPALGELLRHEDPDVRRAARDGLFELAHHSARPEATDDERAAVASALADLATDNQQVRTARESMLRAASLVAMDDTSIAKIATLLDDALLADAALSALGTITAPAAENALVTRLRDGAASGKEAIVRTLARKGGKTAERALQRVCGSPDPILAATARRSLARSGSITAFETLLAAARRGLDGAEDDLLRLARSLETSQPERSVGIYERAFRSGESFVRAAGVLGLGRVAEKDAIPTLFAALGDTAFDVRGAAEEALRRTTQDITTRLSKAAESNAPSRRAAALRIIAARGLPGLRAAILRSIDDPADEVRWVGLGLAANQDDPDIAKRVFALAGRTTDDRERDRALTSFLARTRRAAHSGQASTAREMVAKALEVAKSSGAKSEALEVLAQVAESSTEELLNTHEDLPKESVLQVKIAIADAVADADKERAIGLLREVVKNSGNRDRRNAAAERLSGLGIDMSAVAESAGFITRWKLLGTFPEATKEDLGTLAFAADAATDQPVTVGDESMSFIDHATVDLDGRIDFTKLFKPTDHVVAYAVCDVMSDGGGDVRLMLGSDDGAAVWLNGELLLNNHVARGITTDQDKFDGTLKAGANRIIVKVTQGGGGWGFCLRMVPSENVSG